MLRNSKHFKKIKKEELRPKYSMKKLSVGVVSCMVGYIMFPSAVSAQEPTSTPTTMLVENHALKQTAIQLDEIEKDKLKVNINIPKLENKAAKIDKLSEAYGKVESAIENQNYKKNELDKLIEDSFKDMEQLYPNTGLVRDALETGVYTIRIDGNIDNESKKKENELISRMVLSILMEELTEFPNKSTSQNSEKIKDRVNKTKFRSEANKEKAKLFLNTYEMVKKEEDEKNTKSRKISKDFYNDIPKKHKEILSKGEVNPHNIDESIEYLKNNLKLWKELMNRYDVLDTYTTDVGKAIDEIIQKDKENFDMLVKEKQEVVKTEKSRLVKFLEEGIVGYKELNDILANSKIDEDINSLTEKLKDDNYNEATFLKDLIKINEKLSKYNIEALILETQYNLENKNNEFKAKEYKDRAEYLVEKYNSDLEELREFINGEEDSDVLTKEYLDEVRKALEDTKYELNTEFANLKYLESEDYKEQNKKAIEALEELRQKAEELKKLKATEDEKAGKAEDLLEQYKTFEATKDKSVVATFEKIEDLEAMISEVESNEPTVDDVYPKIYDEDDEDIDDTQNKDEIEDLYENIEKIEDLKEKMKSIEKTIESIKQNIAKEEDKIKKVIEGLKNNKIEIPEEKEPEVQEQKDINKSEQEEADKGDQDLEQIGKNDSKKSQTQPKITKGENQVVKKGEDAVFTIDQDKAKFLFLKVDGNKVSDDKFEIKQGSTIVTIKKDYLDTLQGDKHNVEFVFTDGTVSSTFTTEKETAQPEIKKNSKETLEKEIEKINKFLASEIGREKSKYTPQSASKLLTVFEKALKVMNKENADQEEINQVTEELEAAFKALEEKVYVGSNKEKLDQPKTVQPEIKKNSKETLEKEIEKINKFLVSETDRGNNKYTSQSSAKLLAAFEAALKVLNNEKAEQEEMDKATQELIEAFRALEEKVAPETNFEQEDSKQEKEEKPNVEMPNLEKNKAEKEAKPEAEIKAENSIKANNSAKQNKTEGIKAEKNKAKAENKGRTSKIQKIMKQAKVEKLPQTGLNDQTSLYGTILLIAGSVLGFLGLRKRK